MNEEEKKAFEELSNKVIETVTPAITEKVIAALPQKKNIFGGDSANAEEKEKKEAAVEYLKAKAMNDDVKAKKLSSGTSTEGAELVPTYVSSEIVRLAEKVGLVRQYARKWPLQGGNQDVPTLSSLTAYRVAEGAKITSSQPTTGNVQLRTKTVGVIVPVAKRLLRNASIQLVDAINALAAEAIAKLEDKWALLGLASGEGVFQHASVSGITLGTGDTTYAKVEPEDLLDCIDIVKEEAVNDRMRWVMSLSVLNALRKKRAAVGSDLQGFLLGSFGGAVPKTLWDIPYEVRSYMPRTSEGSQAGKKFIALANFDYVLFGDENVYTLDVSDVATITDTDGSTLINSFEQEMVAVKVTESVDIQLAEPANAFAWIKTAAS
jgi:HK97 family phage major capsid protein